MGKVKNKEMNSEPNGSTVRMFTFVPGYDPPRSIPESGTKEEDVPDIVRNTDSVCLEWRTPNNCVTGHIIQVFYKRHLPHLRDQLIDAESEPLVLETYLNQSLMDKPDIQFKVSTNLTSCLRYRVEVSSMFHDLYQGEIISEPVVQYFKTKPGDRVIEPYTDKKVVPQRTGDISQIVFQFSNRCSSKYYSSICLFPHQCNKSQYTTYTTVENEEQSNKGYYKQSLASLLTCSVYKWEIMAADNNYTLFKEYIFTGVVMEQFEFELNNLMIDMNSGSVGISWTLTQPCIEEYQIQLCPWEGDDCWAGNFSRPKIESDKDFHIEIDLAGLDDFIFELKDCSKHELTIIPYVNQNLLNTRIKMPSYLTHPKPPVNVTVANVTDSSSIVGWVSSACSRDTEMVILREGKTVEEYILSEENLQRCSGYIIELHGLYNNERSKESQIMLATTNHGKDIPISLETNLTDIAVTVIENMTKCVSEYIIDLCEAAVECLENGQDTCKTVYSQLNHTFRNQTEDTLYKEHRAQSKRKLQR